MSDIDAIRDQLGVPEVLDMLDLPAPSRVPGKVLCPMHEDQKPSFWVQEHRWWCFGCGTGGDVIDLVRFITGANFGQAVQFLGGTLDFEDRPSIVRPEPELKDLTAQYYAEALNWGDSEEAWRYATARWPHLQPAQLDAWGVRPSRWYLLVPHFDANGVVRGVKTRSYHREHRAAFEGSNFMQRLYRVVEPAHVLTAVIAEGESDCWTLQQEFRNRYVDVFALPCGANVWRDRWADELRQYNHIYLAMDHDEAGSAAARRIREDHPVELDTLDFPAEHKDVTEAYIAGWRPTV